MIGIYKITSPSSRVYIGQSVNIERRKVQYGTLINCKNQTRLYASLIKYGFSEHIFEVVEECVVEELNAKERYWQDLCNAIGPQGLNCKLTPVNIQKTEYSQQTKERMSASKKSFYKTAKGTEMLAKRTANMNYGARTANTDWEKRTSSIDFIKRSTNTDYRLRTTNTDYTARTANTDYRAFQDKRVSNIDWISMGKKLCIPIYQFSKDGIYLREWLSIKEAGDSLKIDKSGIGQCCKGNLKTSGGFIWKYKQKELEN
jgi:group I intron endonuclease